MAVFNEILVGRFNRQLQKVFGIKGGPPAPQLAADISAQYSFLSGVEDWVGQSWNLYGARSSVGAGAANISVLRFRNPTGSNVIAVLERLTVLGFGAADNPNLSVSFTNLGALNNSGQGVNSAAALDFRTQVIGATCGWSCKNDTAVLGFTNQVFAVPIPAVTSSAEFIIPPIELPCLPGQTYDIAATVVNNGFTVAAYWRERYLEEGERI